jgi:hypothetical protein
MQPSEARAGERGVRVKVDSRGGVSPGLHAAEPLGTARKVGETPRNASGAGCLDADRGAAPKEKEVLA